MGTRRPRAHDGCSGRRAGKRLAVSAPPASETGPADVPGRARRMRSAPARRPAGGAERTARAEPAARPARRPGRPRPHIGRRLGGAAPRGPAAPPADGGEPGARAALPAGPAQDPRGERRAAEPRAPPRDRELLLCDRARTARGARALAAPPRHRPPLRAGGERPPGRPPAPRAGHARRRALSPPPPRPLRRLGARARRLQCRGTPRGPGARPRSRSVLLAPRRARLPAAHQPRVRAPLLRPPPHGRGARAHGARQRALVRRGLRYRAVAERLSQSLAAIVWSGPKRAARASCMSAALPTTTMATASGGGMSFAATSATCWGVTTATRSR